MSLRDAYHRLPDLPLAPFARRVLAKDLQVGDVITTPGLIPLTVEALRDYPSHHLTVVDYASPAGPGARTLISESTVQIAIRKIEQAH